MTEPRARRYGPLPGPPKTRVNISLPDTALATLDQLAANAGMNRSAYIAYLAEQEAARQAETQEADQT